MNDSGVLRTTARPVNDIAHHPAANHCRGRQAPHKLIFLQLCFQGLWVGFFSIDP